MVLVAVVSLDGLLLKVNRAWETILGYPVDQLLNQPFIHLIHPDDVTSTQLAMSRLIKQEDVVGHINRYRCQNGSYRFMEWNAQMRDGLIYAIARDVTERVQVKALLQAEHERMEAAIWGSNDGIWDWDLRDGSAYMSPRWMEQVGFSKEELPNSQEVFYELLHPEDQKRVKHALDDYLHHRMDLYDIEFRLRHKDGSYRWIRSRARPFGEPTGRLTGWRDPIPILQSAKI